METNTLLYIVIALLLVIAIIAVIHYLIVLANKLTTRKKLKTNLGDSTRIRLIHQLREALEYLSVNKIGAIISIENKDNLDMLRTDGVILDANISSSLLISIFNKQSPLHDGAVIIRGNKIYFAATYYKITRKSVDNKYGARHRAALGISEISDAFTIVVSEETGGISLAKNGKLNAIALDQVQEMLISIFKDEK